MACTCAKCTGSGRPHPIYGYDLDAVPAHPCLTCGEPIGSEPYHEYPVWARFGQMFLIHNRCALARGEPISYPVPRRFRAGAQRLPHSYSIG